MVKKFKIERHNATQWRVVNAHLGHGLIFPTKALALIAAKTLNKQYQSWLKNGMTLKTKD